MTDVTFSFNSATRSLKRGQRKTAGQAFDSYSTTMHFEYEPIDFLSGNSDMATEGYVPYIMFRVYDDAGNPLIYSVGSTPKFDGYTFDIPWDVTSRADSMSVEFQLYFVRNDVSLDGRDVAQLSSTEYILSNISSVAIYPTIVSRKGCRPCYTSSPQTEPDVMGYINMFKDYSLMSPVKLELNEDVDRLQLEFFTYLGRADCTVVLNVPYLDSSGRIPAKFLPIITSWYSDVGYFLPTNENIPSALLVHSALMEKTDKTMAIAPWESNLEYGVGSTVIGSDGRVYKSVMDHNIGNDPTLSFSEWTTLMERADVAQEWHDVPSDAFIPSERLVKEALDQKTDKTMAIPWWDPETEYNSGSVVVFEWMLYISMADHNVGHHPEEDDTWWTPIRSSDGEGMYSRPVTRIVGDGVTSEFVIRHGFGSYDFFYQIRYTSSGRSYTDADVMAVDEDHVKVRFSMPPEVNQFTVVLTPAVLPASEKGFVGILGDGVNTEFLVTHNLGSYNFIAQFRLNDEDRTYTDADIRATSLTTATVTFAEPPPVNGVTVMIARALNTAYDEQWVYEQTVPQSEWHIHHPLDRIVSVYLMDSEGRQMDGETTNDLQTLQDVTVRFTEPVTGIAVLR